MRAGSLPRSRIKSTTRLTWIPAGTRPRLWRHLLPKHRWRAPRFLLFPSCRSRPPRRVNDFKPQEPPKATCRVTGLVMIGFLSSSDGGGGEGRGVICTVKEACKVRPYCLPWQKKRKKSICYLCDPAVCKELPDLLPHPGPHAPDGCHLLKGGDGLRMGPYSCDGCKK